MLKRIVCTLCVIAFGMFLIPESTSADTMSIMASTIFQNASVTAASTMTVKFSATLTKSSTVSVTCSLEKKVNSEWKSAGSLPSPDSKSGSSVYSVAKDYSSYCSSGTSYRVVAKFSAGGETISRTSNEIVY